ncbi:MAG: hypothetical protein ABSD44_05210 [Terracidiphilus sp.]
MAVKSHKEWKADPSAFFGRVKAEVAKEMTKANRELRKSGAATLERHFLPAFSEEIFLTFGMDSHCKVGLRIMGGGYRVTAAISGPPNGYELSRKEYLCNMGASCNGLLPADAEGLPQEGLCPEEIAVAIISGILRGRFE